MSSIREELLMKAQRDTSKLVKVQRMVSRGGKTFPQFFWVQPSQVKATDTVVGGQQNLLPKAGSVPTPATGVLDKTYLDSIKSDKAKALAYIKSCGLTWTVSPHDGVNWMRAMMAVKSALNGQNSVKVSAQRNSQTTTNTPATAQASQSNQTTKDTTKAAAMLTPAIQAELSACKSGREKVVVLKKHLGQDKCMEYAKLMGVTWSEHQNHPINIMRMSMALTSYFDATDGTISLTKTSTPKGKVGAPDGNKNAQKDGVKQEDKKPEPPSEDIDILPSFTPRQKALAEMLNKTTSTEDLQLFKSTGIIAEDDAAKEFIKNNLYKAYYTKKSSSSYRALGSSRDFSKNSADVIGPIIKGLPKRIVRDGLNNYVDSNYSNLSVLLYPRDIVPGIITREATPYTRGYGSASTYTGRTLSDLLDILDMGYTRMASDDSNDPKYQGNMGYTGWDVEKTKAQFQKFGVENTGVGAVIKHISDNDPELANEAQSMIQDYQDMLTICGGNPQLLRRLVSDRKYDYESIKKEQAKFKTESEAVSKLVEVMTDLKSKYNLSSDDIEKTLSGLQSSYHQGTLQRDDGTSITDASGNTVDVYDMLNNIFVYDAESDKNVSVASYLSSGWSSASKYAAADVILRTGKTLKELTEDDLRQSFTKHPIYGDMTGILEDRDKANALSQISEQDYMSLQQKMLHFSGQKMQKLNAQNQYEDVDLSQMSAKDFDDLLQGFNYYSSSPSNICLVSDKENPQKDVILSNMMNIGASTKLLSKIHSQVPQYCPASKANGDGRDYTANFDFYDGGPNSGRDMYSWGSPSKMTSSEINTKLGSQIDNAPVMTVEQYKQLKEYVKKNGVNYNNITDEKDDMIRKAESLRFQTESSMEGHKGSPVYDLLASQVQLIAKYCPQMKTARVKTDADVVNYVNKKLDYTPYNAPKVIDTNGTPQQGQLKQLREETLAKVHCSLKSADDSQRDSIETRVKHDWDKEKRDANGKRLYGYITCKFNGVYQIRNSAAEEVFQNTIQNLPKTPPANLHGNSYETKVVSMFHGTDFRGACGIVGVDGKFRAPSDAAEAAKNGQKFAGRMLGQGVYLADLAGKSAGYFGDWGAGYNKRGALLICNAVLGDHLTAPDYNSVRYHTDVDSVSMKAGTNTGGSRVLRADEWCIRKPEYVSPQFIVDAEALRR